MSEIILRVMKDLTDSLKSSNRWVLYCQRKALVHVKIANITIRRYYF